jgi:tetratricopeptide (TPR) repeat protein
VARAEAEPVGTVPLKANDYRYALATMLYLAGRYDQAAPTFRRALEFDIALFPAHVQLARISEARQDWDDAVRERQAAIDANPEDPGLVTDLGVTLFRAGKLEEASEAFTQAMGAAPRDARVPYLAGIVALRLGRQDAAREALTRFLALAPSRFAPQIAETREQLRALDAPH